MSDTLNQLLQYATLDRLFELAKADQRGLVEILPCKEGDTVFEVRRMTQQEALNAGTTPTYYRKGGGHKSGRTFPVIVAGDRPFKIQQIKYIPERHRWQLGKSIFADLDGAKAYQSRMNDTLLRFCDKACIDNVKGRCAIKDCKGPVGTVGAPLRSHQKAAKEYISACEHSKQNLHEGFDTALDHNLKTYLVGMQKLLSENETVSGLRECSKFCIANVGGKCAVKDCTGEIKSSAQFGGQNGYKTPEDAAKFYEMSQKAFTEAFSDDFVDEDTEE